MEFSLSFLILSFPLTLHALMHWSSKYFLSCDFLHLASAFLVVSFLSQLFKYQLHDNIL